MKRTPLYSSHESLGGKIIDFGGWAMPVRYTGIIAEHKHVREKIGLFDVSHMGEARIKGAQAREDIQRVITNDANKLVPGSALYTLICKEDGGIVDDCIVYCESDQEFLIILNASNREKDVSWLQTHCTSSTVTDESDETVLIAVQGPGAVAWVNELAQDDVSTIKPFHFSHTHIDGIPVMAARTGYTGEDGFELACPADQGAQLWNRLLESDDAMAIGLGARDTLRLEAKLCLYGNDIDETTTPLEAGLGWAVKLDTDFIGKAALVKQKESGVTRKLVGFRIEERKIARPGYPVVDQDGSVIGRVTSGTKGISVEGSIGMAYVPIDRASPDSEIIIDCRGSSVPATITKGKFYKREK